MKARHRACATLLGLLLLAEPGTIRAQPPDTLRIDLPGITVSATRSRLSLDRSPVALERIIDGSYESRLLKIACQSS